MSITGNVTYSRTVSVSFRGTGTPGISIAPNPVREILQLHISSLAENSMKIFIYDFAGRLMRISQTMISKGNSSISLTDFGGWPPGIYSLKALIGENVFVQKMVLVR
jgi:hypothetical protein